MAKNEPILKILLDTNILVSAIISSGKARAFLNKGINGRFSLVISEPILEELSDVLRRPKFKMTEAQISRIAQTLLQTAEIVEMESDFKILKEDPDDDKILNTAYDGQADIIVTGDHHLLDLKTFKGIKIVGLSEALLQF